MIATIAILHSCGDNNQRKAEKLITNYLKEHLDDWDSYEPIEFSELMPKTLKDVLEMEIKGTREQIDYYKRWEADPYMKSRYEGHMRELDSLTTRYNEADSVIIHYLITHTYRAANKFGGKERYYKWYKINADITEVSKYLE